MNSIQGPGIFLAQFLRNDPPFDTLKNIGTWVAGLGYRGVQIPTWETQIFDLGQAASSRSYCDDLKGRLAELNLQPTELAAHLQGAHSPGELE